jgi:hypothetical protein
MARYVRLPGQSQRPRTLLDFPESDLGRYVFTFSFVSSDRKYTVFDVSLKDEPDAGFLKPVNVSLRAYRELSAAHPESDPLSVDGEEMRPYRNSSDLPSTRNRRGSQGLRPDNYHLYFGHNS